MKISVYFCWLGLQKKQRDVKFVKYLLKTRLSTSKLSPMKADLQLESTPITSLTVLKLVLIGSLVLGCVYGVLVMFSSAVKILE
jgi:hypothetical protein